MNRCKVLLAGDARERRARLAMTLRGQGFDVLELTDWLHLVTCIREVPLFSISGDPADVIVLDLRASGAAALARVNAAAPVGASMVVITAPGARPLESGARDDWVVFEEPVDIELLRNAVIGVSQLRG